MAVSLSKVESDTWLAAARAPGIVSTGPDGQAIVRPADGPDRWPLADEPPFTGPGPALQDTSPPAPERRRFRAFGR
ncbi:hypothetical protein [Streptomyces humi]|uniref:hypothetical protein n=1 Tax=Streptomyces humi TaxID=1428620 RepID=UPI0006288BDF|nr:hypothetical protein [Streptomyces humi]